MCDEIIVSQILPFVNLFLIKLIFAALARVILSGAKRSRNPSEAKGDRNAVGSRAEAKIFLNSAFCILHFMILSGEERLRHSLPLTGKVSGAPASADIFPLAEIANDG